MEMYPLHSTNIDSAGYDQGNLIIQFTNGDRYVYHGISPELFRAFINAPSHGQFFHKFIKNEYPFDRLG